MNGIWGVRSLKHINWRGALAAPPGRSWRSPACGKHCSLPGGTELPGELNVSFVGPMELVNLLQCKSRRSRVLLGESLSYTSNGGKPMQRTHTKTANILIYVAAERRSPGHGQAQPGIRLCKYRSNQQCPSEMQQSHQNFPSSPSLLPDNCLGPGCQAAASP